MKSLLGFTCLLIVFNAYAELGLNAIYKKNDLQFVKKNSSAKIQELSKSVAMIIHKDTLVGNKIKTTKLKDPNGLNICPNEKFANSNSVSACTGFLIAPDLILTAGHCFESIDDCENKLIIFDVLNAVFVCANEKSSCIIVIKLLAESVIVGETGVGYILSNKRMLVSSILG